VPQFLFQNKMMASGTRYGIAIRPQGLPIDGSVQHFTPCLVCRCKKKNQACLAETGLLPIRLKKAGQSDPNVLLRSNAKMGWRNSGRRSGQERRQGGTPIDFQDRRCGRDRRGRHDRRSGEDRRSPKGMRRILGLGRRIFEGEFDIVR
jgi:hypothetical protein